jgi:hypothetical protein
MTTSEFSSRWNARPGFRRSDINAQEPAWLSAIYDKMCRTGTDTQFKQCLSVIASFARLSGAQIGLNGRCNGGRHKIVSSEERIETRKKFLLDEKEFTRVLDEVNPQRRDLPFGEIHGIGDCCPDLGVGRDPGSDRGKMVQ